MGSSICNEQRRCLQTIFSVCALWVLCSSVQVSCDKGLYGRYTLHIEALETRWSEGARGACLIG